MILSMILAISDDTERNRVIEIYEHYSGNMYSLAFSILNNSHDAEDAVMYAFEKIIRNIGKFIDTDIDSVSGLVMIYTRCSAIDIYRKNKNRAKEHVEDFSDPCDDVSNIVITKEMSKIIADAINSLSDKQKDIVILKYYYNHSDEEIALITGMTNDAVRQSLVRARRRLYNSLEKEIR